MGEATRQLHLMGTVITLGVQAAQPQALLNQATTLLQQDEQRFSANSDDSELMQVNHAAGQHPVVVTSDLFELIRIGKQASLQPDSALNIAIGPLVQTWRIGFDNARHPSDAELQAKLPLIDPNQIELDIESRSVFLTHAGMAIDLGALAKGYFADQIITLFKQADATAGYIDLGGNVMTFGPNPHAADGNWRIGIQNPFLPRGNQALTLTLQNASVVTSGIYERVMQWHGHQYHHVLDRHTGYPIHTDLASLSIITPRSLDGELWTTRLFGTTPADIIRLIERTPQTQAVVITATGEMAMTKGLQA